MASRYKRITSQTVISSQPGSLDRIIFNGIDKDATVKFWDGTTGAGDQAVTGSITRVQGSGTSVEIGVGFGTGLMATVNGSLDITVAFNGDPIRPESKYSL